MISLHIVWPVHKHSLMANTRLESIRLFKHQLTCKCMRYIDTLLLNQMLWLSYGASAIVFSNHFPGGLSYSLYHIYDKLRDSFYLYFETRLRCCLLYFTITHSYMFMT